MCKSGPDHHEIFDRLESGDSCSSVLDDILDRLERDNPYSSEVAEVLEQLADDDPDISEEVIEDLDTGSNYSLSRIIGRVLTECAQTESDKTIAVLDQLIRQNAPRQRLERGLEAIGDAAISDINDLIVTSLQDDIQPPGNYVPHLYRNREQELVNQISIWYDKNKWFFKTAVGSVLRYSLTLPPGATDPNLTFHVDVGSLYQQLRTMAAQEGLDPDDVNGFSDKTEVRAYLLTEDLYHNPNYDCSTIKHRLQQYPNLEEFLDDAGWEKDVKSHNRHPIVSSLNSDYSESSDYLSHLDYCLSYIDPSSDRVSDLQDHLLSRHQSPHTVPELQIIALLRRHFGNRSTEIEAPIPNSEKDTDAKVDIQGKGVRVEVISPDPEEIIRMGGTTIQSYNRETNPARGKITRKAEGQLDAVKTNTNDLTLLAISKRLIGIGEMETEEYVLGQQVLEIRDGELFTNRRSSTVTLDPELKNVDYILTFGPRKTDTDISNPDARMFVIQYPPESVTTELGEAFDAEINYYPFMDA